MSMPRFEAAGRYVIDWERRRLSSACCDAEIASKRAERWNDAVKRGLDEDDPDDYDWEFDAADAAVSPAVVSLTKPDDCPEHYWASPFQCMEVRDAIAREVADDVDRLVIADWCQLFQYAWRALRKGQTISDLRKVEHYSRIIRERLEGRR